MTTRIDGSAEKALAGAPASEPVISRSPRPRRRRDHGRTEVGRDALHQAVGDIQDQRAVGEVVLPDLVARDSVGAHRHRGLADGGGHRLDLHAFLDPVARAAELARRDRRLDAGDALHLTELALLPPPREPQKPGEHDRNERDRDKQATPASAVLVHQQTGPSSPLSARPTPRESWRARSARPSDCGAFARSALAASHTSAAEAPAASDSFSPELSAERAPAMRAGTDTATRRISPAASGSAERIASASPYASCARRIAASQSG